MADNFRNKQWFKNLSQDRKDEICKKFDIDEKTLRKAGRETSDGRIVIDLLRIDHNLHIPSEWEELYKLLKDVEIPANKIDTNDVLIKISVMEFLYNIVHNDTVFLKYKSNLHNDLITNEAFKYTIDWYNKLKESVDIEDNKFYCYQIFTHVKCLLESDLNLIKNNS